MGRKSRKQPKPLVESRRATSYNKKRPVLLINQNWMILTPISVKRALSLYVSGKCDFVLEDKDHKVHPLLDIGMPIIARLKDFKSIPYRQIPLRRRHVFERDDFVCQYTGELLSPSEATVDHVIPRSFPDSPGNTWENLVTCSKKANNYKGNRTPEQAGMKLMRKPQKPTWDNLILKKRKEWKDFFDNMSS